VSPGLLALVWVLLFGSHPARGQFTCQNSCPDKDAQSLSYGGNVSVTVLRAVNLPNKDVFGPMSRVSDPYVKVWRPLAHV
jgi:hypothetical protein